MLLEQAQPPETGAFAAAEHEVVKDSAIQCFGSRGEAAGRAAVAIARRWLPARMIVGQDQAATAVSGGIEDDFAHGERDLGRIPFVEGNVKAMRSIVHMRDPRHSRPGRSSAKQPEKKFFAAESPSSLSGELAR